MKRRTVLKGAAAAAGGVGLRRSLTSAAGSGAGAGRSLTGRMQTPSSYELISFFVSYDIIQDGDTAWRGTARDITNAGTIIGETVVNGLMTPTIWDPALNPRYPDLGPYLGQHAYGNLISDDGRATGATIPASELRTEAQAQGAEFAERIPLFWQGDQLDTALVDATSTDTVINALADTGLMLGVSDNLPTRWIGSTPSQPELPQGFTGGGYRSFNSAGDLAGALFQLASPPTGAVPFVQTSSGELQLFDPPGGNAPDWIGRLQVFGLTNDLSFVAVARGETDLFGQAYRYLNGQQTQLADLSGEGMFVRGANANGVLVGQALLNGVSIPTMWVNDQPLIIADMLVPGPDLLLLNVNAINDSNVMVGEAEDSNGVGHHVLIRPV